MESAFAGLLTLVVSGATLLICTQAVWGALRERRNNKRIARRLDDYDPPFAV